MSGIALFPGTGAAQNNPIVTENQQSGTSQWRIPWGSVGNDTLGQIKGYASATSVNKGENITFYVSVNPAQTYTIDVYRMGWYQGLGGRLMQHIGPLNGFQQQTCPTDAVTGMIECRWAPAFTLATQTSWTSGIYLALLTNAQGYRNYIVFVVRDDNRVAPLLYQQPVTTYQAYNNYPYNSQTGKSLYGFNSFGATTVTGGRNAAKVSFDRPYLGDGTGADYSQSFLQWEVFFIRWMEKSGYDVTYSTDIDTHTNGQRLLRYRGLLVAGHDEYWSKPMYDAVVAARDAGVNLAFFGANVAGWQVRFESSTSGVPNRVMVCYRVASIDPVTDVSLKTVEWRSTVLNRPEQTFVGVQYSSNAPWNQGFPPYVVTNSGNWVYAGSGFKDGDAVPGILGYEVDRSFSNYPQPNALTGTYTLLSNSPVGSGFPNAQSSVYQAVSGAWIFAAGTMSWSWALDNYNGTNLADARLQRTTANILNRFIGPDFSLSASVSSRTVTPGASTSYGITINAAGGFTDAVTLSVGGLPSGANGSFSPNLATASSTLSVTTSAATPAGSYTLTITGSSGNLTRATTVSLAVSALQQPPPLPDFALSVSPSTQTVGPGGSTNYSVTINPISGFTGQVVLSVSGLPNATNSNFSSNPATLSSNLSVTTSPSTPVGTYTVTITGVSANLTHTTAAALTVAINAPPPVSSNKVLNPGFENGLSPWTTYGAATLVSSPVYSGQYAAQVQANSGVTQEISGLLPNTNYILTAQARVEVEGSTVWVGVKYHGGPEQYQGIVSTKYTPANVTFTTGPSSTSALIYLWVNAGDPGRAWGDEYAVVQAPSGTYTLAASPSSIAAAGTIVASWTAPPGQTAATDWIGLYAMGTPNTSPVSSASTGGATTGTLNFTAPATSGTFELRYLNSSYALLATSNAITVTVSSGSSNKVLNPGFENGLSPWTIYGAATLVTSPVFSGQYAAQVQASSGVFQQINGLLPNTMYVLTARARVEVAASTVWVGVKNHGGPEQYQGIVSTSYTTANVTFTTGPSSTSAMIYLWLNAGVSGRAWGDDYTVSGP